MKQPEVGPGGDPVPILERFPEHKDNIRDLSRGDPAFRELCGDYEECVAALQRFRDQGTDAIGLVEDYAELRVGLEHELLAGIARQQGGSTNPHLRREE